MSTTGARRLVSSGIGLSARWIPRFGSAANRVDSSGLVFGGDKQSDAIATRENGVRIDLDRAAAAPQCEQL